MRALLDTHVLFWQLDDPGSLKLVSRCCLSASLNHVLLLFPFPISSCPSPGPPTLLSPPEFVGEW